MRHVLILMVCGLTLMACQEKTEAPLATTAAEQPNILWIVSEDNSPWLGSYGDELATTPRLDALAEESIRYTRAYSNAPVCAPSRNALITGAYPIAFGTEHMRSGYKIPDEVRFYPGYLREAGYYTTNNYKKDYNTVDQPDAWDESSREASYRNRADDQPFFHITNLNVTHESRLHYGSIATNHDPDAMQLAPYHPDTPEARNDYAVYYDRLEELDGQVGEILDALEADGLAENTIVFYYSDHGGAVGGTKRFLTEGTWSHTRKPKLWNDLSVSSTCPLPCFAWRESISRRTWWDHQSCTKTIIATSSLTAAAWMTGATWSGR